MRAFGIFAAFAAVTAVFAAPVPAPAPAPALDAVAVVQARDLTDDMNAILCTLKSDMDGLIPQIENALADAASDMDGAVNNIIPLLTQMTGCITSAVTNAGLKAVENLFEFKEKREVDVDVEKRTISLQDIGTLIEGIEQAIADILCKIATAIGPDYPNIAAMLQGIITIMNALTTALGEACTDLAPYLPAISDVLGALGWFGIPGFN